MNLSPNPFTRAIKSGQKQIGLWVSLCSPFAAEVVAPAGFDWVLLDMEHSPGELTSIMGQLQVFAAYPTTAIVRPDWNDPVKVKRLLDIGAPGLLFPMVQNAEEAKLAVAATRYPPRGMRGVSASTRGNKFGRVGDYFGEIENETTVIVQVETLAALDQAAAIGSVDGVSGVFFGPADIAADMGLLGQPMAPAVWEQIWACARGLIAKNIPVGTLVADPLFASELLADGFTFVACGSDIGILAKGADSLMAQVKGAIS
ncbi:MAG: aldolase/citrate lyase family protein [Paracoccaceae bacterium]